MQFRVRHGIKNICSRAVNGYYSGSRLSAYFKFSQGFIRQPAAFAHKLARGGAVVGIFAFAHRRYLVRGLACGKTYNLVKQLFGVIHHAFFYKFTYALRCFGGRADGADDFGFTLYVLVF